MSTVTKTKFELKGNAVISERVFDAPASLVFDAWINPEIIPKWWGPRSMQMTECKVDLRVGGKYSFNGTCEGQECPFIGEFLEIDPPNKLVYTEIFDTDYARNSPATNTITFEEVNGKTHMKCITTYPSEEIRDMVFNMSCDGMNTSYDRFEEYLASVQ